LIHHVAAGVATAAHFERRAVFEKKISVRDVQLANVNGIHVGQVIDAMRQGDDRTMPSAWAEHLVGPGDGIAQAVAGMDEPVESGFLRRETANLKS